MSIISVFTDQIRNDRLRKYESLIAELALEARKKKEAFRWTAHQVGFGPLARMYYVSRHDDHADVEKHGDGRAIFTRVFGEKRGEKQLEDIIECLVSSERQLGTDRPDLSYSKDASEAVSPIASLALIRARPGKQDAVEALLHKFAEAIPKTGESATLNAAQALTGDMLVYWLVRPLNRLADLDKQSVGRDLLVKAYGQKDGSRIWAEGAEATDQLQREIIFYREDLSNPRG